MKIKLSYMISVPVFASLLFKASLAIADLPKFCKVNHSSSGVLNCNLPVGEYIETENYDWGSAFIRGRHTYIGNKPADARSPSAILGYLDISKKSEDLNIPENISVISVACKGKGKIGRLGHHSGKFNYDWISCNTPNPSCKNPNDSNDQFNCQMDSNITVTCPNKEFHVTYFRAQDDMLECQNPNTGERAAINVSYDSGSRLKPFTTEGDGIVKCITNGGLGYWQGTVGKSSGNFKCFINSPQAQEVGVYGQVVTLY